MPPLRVRLLSFLDLQNFVGDYCILLSLLNHGSIEISKLTTGLLFWQSCPFTMSWMAYWRILQPSLVYHFKVLWQRIFTYCLITMETGNSHANLYWPLVVNVRATFTLWPRAVTMKLIQRPYGKLKIKFVWSRAFKYSVVTYMTGLSTACYIITIQFMWALLQYVIRNQGLLGFEVSWSLDFVLDSILWGGPDAKFSRLWNSINSMPRRTPCRLFIHSNFLGPLGFKH